MNPSLQEALQSGIAAAQKGDRDEAHRIFKETAELHPNVSEVWIWLGGTSTQLDEAEQAFEKAQALDPANEQASLGLRWVQLRKASAATEAPASITGAAVPAPPSPVWDQVLQAQHVELPPTETPEQAAQAPAQAQEAVQVPETAQALQVPQVPEVPAQPATTQPIWEQQRGNEASGNTTTTGTTAPGGWVSNNLRLAILVVLVVALAVLVFLLIR